MEILKYFRGNELQNYFTKIVEDNLRAIIKPQYVDHLPRQVSGKVLEILTQKNDNNNMDEMVRELGIALITSGATCRAYHRRADGRAGP